MVRRYHARRYRRRYVSGYTKQAYSELLTHNVVITQGNSAMGYSTIAVNENNAEDNAPLSQQIRIGSCYATASCVNVSGANNVYWNARLYIFYVPEGYGATAAMLDQHPEWVLAMKDVGGGESVSVRTRRSVLLKPGDRLCAGVIYTNVGVDNIAQTALRTNIAGHFFSKYN